VQQRAGMRCLRGHQLWPTLQHVYLYSVVYCRVEVGAATGWSALSAGTPALASTTVSWPATVAPASLSDLSDDDSFTGTTGSGSTKSLNPDLQSCPEHPGYMASTKFYQFYCQCT
jgi:hypothetical protein